MTNIKLIKPGTQGITLDKCKMTIQQKILAISQQLEPNIFIYIHERNINIHTLYHKNCHTSSNLIMIKKYSYLLYIIVVSEV